MKSIELNQNSLNKIINNIDIDSFCFSPPKNGDSFGTIGYLLSRENFNTFNIDEITISSSSLVSVFYHLRFLCINKQYNNLVFEGDLKCGHPFIKEFYNKKRRYEEEKEADNLQIVKEFIGIQKK